MRSHHRGSRLGSWGIGAALAVVLALAIVPTARAQPGFGPDPFWPYNSQYAPYTSPMGPGTPSGGGNERWLRSGIRGANQFQDYLNDLTAGSPGRLNTDRAGIGMPGYRSAVDPTWGGGAYRTYQPNVRTTPTFDEAQRRIADTYFAYMSERDPRRRVALLNQYRQVRRASDRLLTSGTRTPSQVLDAASAGGGRGSASRRGTETAGQDQPSRSSRSTSSRRSLPPPPPVPAGTTTRSGNRSRPSPSRVLERAGSMDGDDAARSSGARSSATRNRPSSPTTPRED